jgi:hypothetical protein
VATSATPHIFDLVIIIAFFVAIPPHWRPCWREIAIGRSTMPDATHFVLGETGGGLMELVGWGFYTRLCRDGSG